MLADFRHRGGQLPEHLTVSAASSATGAAPDTIDAMDHGQQQPYDLRTLFKAVGRVGGRGGDNAAGERVDANEPVEVLDRYPLRVEAAPIDVTGFVDGIQSSMHLTHRDQRPVILSYVAAGALAPGARPVALVERLRLWCAELDVEWSTSVGGSIPIEVLSDAPPPDMETAALRRIGSSRDDVEREVVNGLVRRNDPGVIVVDGSVMTRVRSNRIVGVVKTLKSRYLADESVVWKLPKGWRSPRFAIGSGEQVRYSCYVQLVDKSEGAWNLGLIRLEAFDVELLEPLAARCLTEAQTASGGDPRWDRHLGSMRAVEDFLRARRPAAFSL
jgi:hypothetical protein